MREGFPECQALLGLHGIGTFTALVLLAEWGDVTRFHTAKQAAAYTGLTAKVEQSGTHCHHDHITKQGSPWMRWVLIDAAMKIVGHDVGLANFYTRIRKALARRSLAWQSPASWRR